MTITQPSQPPIDRIADLSDKDSHVFARAQVSGLPAALAKLDLLRRATVQAVAARDANPVTGTLYAGPATVTQAAAVDAATTLLFDAWTDRARFNYFGGRSSTSSAGNGVGLYAYQDLQGTNQFTCSVGFQTDSPSLTIRLRRQNATKFRLLINGRYVTAAPVTYSTADATYNNVVVSGLTGAANRVEIEIDLFGTRFGAPVFHGVYVQPGRRVWPIDVRSRLAVFGDSYTYGANATFGHLSFAKRLGRLLGCDDTWAFGYSGTGYVASLVGTSFTGATTAGSAVVAVANTSGLAAGQPILGTGAGNAAAGVPRYAKIVSVVANTSVTLTAAATATASGVSMFAPNTGLVPLDYYSAGVTRLAQNVADMPAAPDVVAFALGYNDDVNTTGYEAIVAATLAEARRLCPRALIVVLGVPHSPINGGQSGGPNYVSAFSTNAENRVASAVAAFADPLTVMVRNSTDPLGSWLYGTGRTSATTGTGNTDFYTSSDGNHPADAGHDYLASRAAAKVVEAMAALSTT